MTGKRVPIPPKGLDHITPKPLPYEVTVRETAQLAQDMADARQRWASMTPYDRNSHEGHKMRTAYKRMSYQFKELTGQEPVPIYADQ